MLEVTDFVGMNTKGDLNHARNGSLLMFIINNMTNI